MRPLPSGGSGWIVVVSLVRWVIHPLLQGVATHGEGKLELQLFLRTSLFLAHFTTFNFHSFLLYFLICFLVFFHSCCSHAQVFGRTLVHEFNVLQPLYFVPMQFTLFWLDFSSVLFVFFHSCCSRAQVSGNVRASHISYETGYICSARTAKRFVSKVLVSWILPLLF